VIRLLLALCGLAPLVTWAQDSLYARRVISELCGTTYFGRGYLKGGLAKAEKFIIGELERVGAKPLLPQGFSQPFVHPVNTFPSTCRVKLNGKKLRPGIDFITDPASHGARGKFILQRKDSVTFTDAGGKVAVELKKKLTFSVAGNVSGQCVIEVDRAMFPATPQQICLNVKNKLVTEFQSRNVIAVLPGTSASDSMLLFTAHYDHLGGLGKKTFFPGANDNASGVSMVLNLARHYAAHPHRYRTVFIFFAGEEAGLLGSAHFVRNKTVDLGKIRFLINLDLLGTGDDGIMVVNGAVHESDFTRLQQLNEKTGLVKEIRKRGRAANSDHYPFSEAGVKALFIYTLGGTTAYHDVRDVEKDLPLTDYQDVLKLILAFAETL
jgi:aminopeptidase YwaD